MSLIPTEGRMTVSEKAERKKLESVVQNWLDSYVDVGRALERIRDAKLYRDQWKTFEAYVEDQFGFSRPRAYQLIDAVKQVDRVKNLSTIVDKTEFDILPNDNTARAFSQVPDEEMQEVLDVVVEEHKATGKPVTGKSIKEAAAKVADKQTPEPTIAEQISSHRSVAMQHYKSAMRAVDDMNRLRRDPDNIKIVETANVTIQDAVKGGWK